MIAMRTILILIGRYLPGYKDGGPLCSIKNLTDRLGSEYNFYIITADRDHGDTESYPEILHNSWNQVGNAKVWYVKPGGFSMDLIEEKAAKADVVYLCGCFNDYARATLKLKKQGRINAKVVVAAMGLFSPGALQIKYWKKKIYIESLKAFGYFRGIEWSATDEMEVENIQDVVGKKAVCCKAQDLPRQINNWFEPTAKSGDIVKIIFLSRISRKKNLSYALSILLELESRVIFDIYGVMEDKEYFEECMQIVKKMPPNIRVMYKGEVHSEKVIEIFSKYQIFLFPTLGENYGHVIYEAMAGGCIPVISNRTPWSSIEREGIGKVVPLEKKESFVQAVRELADISDVECLKRQKKAIAYAQRYSLEINCEGYRQIFDTN